MPITPTSTQSKNYQALGIDEIANDIETVFNAVNALPAAPTTTTVNISSAQILAMGSTPIELLPAPGANMYYDWSVRLEHNHVTNGYTLTGDTFVCGGGTSYYGCYFYNFALGVEDEAIMMNPAPDFLRTVSAVDYPTFSGQKMNDALVLTTLNGTDPTLGDGTWRAIITYTTRTFGA